MKLVSLKEVLPQAPSASHRMAKKRHFRRAIVTGLIAASLAAGSITGISYWTSHKDKMEQIAREPYSALALETRLPMRTQFLSMANEHSLRLDATVREYLTTLKRKSDSTMSARGEPVVFYTLTISATGKQTKLTFPLAEKILMQYLVGGKWNAGHISKENFDLYMRYFSEPDTVAGLIKLFQASELGRWADGRTLFEMRFTSTQHALALDDSAYALSVKTRQMKTRLLEWFDSNLDNLYGLLFKEGPNSYQTNEKIEESKAAFRQIFVIRENAISNYLLGGSKNSFTLSKAEFNLRISELESFSKSLDSLNELTRKSPALEKPMQ